MDKRVLANQQVKEKIEDALFALLEEKKIDEITITELINKAGVARSSFYRNYDSVFDILKSAIEDVCRDFTASNPIDRVDFTSLTYLSFVFSFYLRMKDRLLCIFRAGFSYLILQELTNYNLEALGTMSTSSIDRYDIYYYSGALFSVIAQWLETGAKERVEEMAAKFKSLVVNRSSTVLL